MFLTSERFRQKSEESMPHSKELPGYTPYYLEIVSGQRMSKRMHTIANSYQ